MSNVTALTDSWQLTTDEYTYDAWGKLRNAIGTTANSQLFKGEHLAYRQDPNAGPDSLFALHHRHYASEIGRFTSEDPAADDLNLYRYVGNNPVNAADPSGLAYAKRNKAKGSVPHINDIMKRLGSDPQHIPNEIARTLAKEGNASEIFHTNEYGKLTSLLLIPAKDSTGNTSTLVLTLNVYTWRFWKESDWSVKAVMKQSLEEAQETLAAERHKNLDRFLLLHQNKMTIHFGALSVATGGWGAIVGASQIGGAVHSEWTGEQKQGLITQGVSSGLQAGGVEKEAADQAGQITEFGLGFVPGNVPGAKYNKPPKIKFGPKPIRRYSKDPVTFENVADDLANNKPSVKNAPDVQPAESVPSAKVDAPSRIPKPGDADFIGPLTQPQEYSRLVKSNRPWSWAEDYPGGADLTAGQRKAIRVDAIKQGLIPDVPFKAGTKFPDFEAAGLLRRVDDLPESLWKAGDKAQFDWLDSRIPGGKPAGTTWHHSEIPGRMELVEFGPHNILNHRGGRSPGMWADAPR